jgi:HSP20 family protein
MSYRRFMWSEALDLLEQAERLHRQFFQCADARTGPAWEPPADVFETEDGLVLLIALPGVPPEAVRVSADERVLRVSGSRPWPEPLRRARIWRLEIPQGRFERVLELPPGRFEVAHQELSHGCVAIHLRRV